MKTPTAPTTMTRIVTACAALLVLAGCIPEKRVVWSHDGKRAAVITDESLHLINEEGQILKPVLHREVVWCNWFSDDKRVLLCVSEKATQWSELSPVLNPEQQAAVKKHATKLRDRVMAYNGDWEQFDLDPDKRIPSSIKPAVPMYMRDVLGEGMAKHVGEKWNDIENMKIDIWQLQVFTIGDSELIAGDVILHSLSEFHQPKLAPDDKNVAILMEPADSMEEIPALHVLPVQKDATTRVVAKHAAYDFDWSPDGQSLVFIRSSAPNMENSDNIALGSLTTTTVADKSGHLLEEWEETHDRAGLLFNSLMGARWLSDGRIIFSSVEVALPATSRDMPKAWTLFAWDPKMPASISRIIGRDFDRPLEVDIPLFEISPDEKRVLLPGPDGRVILYNFVSGEATDIVSDDAPRGRTRMLATWKSNTEVCFTINPLFEEDKTTPGDVAVWKDGKTRILSKSWPEEMKHGWLTDK